MLFLVDKCSSSPLKSALATVYLLCMWLSLGTLVGKCHLQGCVQIHPLPSLPPSPAQLLSLSVDGSVRYELRDLLGFCQYGVKQRTIVHEEKETQHSQHAVWNVE